MAYGGSKANSVVPGHPSLQTTERYPGCKLRIQDAERFSLAGWDAIDSAEGGEKKKPIVSRGRKWLLRRGVGETARVRPDGGPPMQSAQMS
jgi:hypothetical protein